MDPLAERANSLYWDSDASVNDIADELDLSKGSLYGMIEPRGASLACPDCGSELEYPNRTAREKGFLTCGECGLEEEEEVIRGLAGEAITLYSSAPDEARSRRTLWATALLGAAAGIMIARWMRR
ncbi:hypothetical protein [Gaopeijia maritima]|uniref:TFIIB-type zinc ribbon-containing protein n=1 Tax=Gaopeijia maritima TaxID=3119007 RepID=A0ABU9E6Z1_9BACT